MGSRNQRQIFLVSLAVLLVAPACLLFGRPPRILSHQAPAMPAASPEFDVGCPDTDGNRRCPAGSPAGELGCSIVRPAGEVLSGLSPAEPLLVCLVGGPGVALPPEGEYFYSEGCLVARAVRYLVNRGGKLVMLANEIDLQASYAPIQSEVEALSYALAATGLGVRYGQAPEAGLRYFVRSLEDSHVRLVEGGYLVHLYDYKICGCGPHPTSTVDILVTFNGEVKELSREKVYEDPAEDGMCVD